MNKLIENKECRATNLSVTACNSVIFQATAVIFFTEVSLYIALYHKKIKAFQLFL